MTLFEDLPYSWLHGWLGGFSNICLLKPTTTNTTKSIAPTSPSTAQPRVWIWPLLPNWLDGLRLLFFSAALKLWWFSLLLFPGHGERTQGKPEAQGRRRKFSLLFCPVPLLRHQWDRIGASRREVLLRGKEKSDKLCAPSLPFGLPQRLSFCLVSLLFGLLEGE